MSGVIGTGSLPRLLQDGVANVFGDSLKEHEPCYNKMFEDLTSKKNFEVDVQFEGFSRSSNKPEGDDITFDSRRQGFTPKYQHSTLGKGFIVTREALEDELYGQLSDGARALSRAMMIGRELDGAGTFNNGFDATVVMIDGDGADLFNTAHSNGPSGGTYSNRLAIDADLTEASLEDALAIAQTMTDARGLPAALQVQRLVVAAGTNSFNAQRILGSVLQNDTGNNATNAVRDMNSVRDGWLSNPYLTDTDAWFLITDAPQGLKYYTRRALEFGQDNAFASENARFKATMRYVFGWTDARGAIGSQGN
mgnify:CR=1 FL=1|jgi:hypothetical protein|tara:strand:- start:1157 stop:2080 length:924 start_codon:yes stop_codon:yes gene_type:complete